MKNSNLFAWNTTIQEMEKSRKESLYICPNWEKCLIPCDCKFPHQIIEDCSDTSHGCPACIEITQENYNEN